MFCCSHCYVSVEPECTAARVRVTVAYFSGAVSPHPAHTPSSGSAESPHQSVWEQKEVDLPMETADQIVDPEKGTVATEVTVTEGMDTVDENDGVLQLRDKIKVQRSKINFFTCRDASDQRPRSRVHVARADVQPEGVHYGTVACSNR